MVFVDGAAGASDAADASDASPTNKTPSATPARSAKLSTPLLLALANLATLEKMRLATIFFSPLLRRVGRESTSGLFLLFFL
jgi:hypothetical protein